MGFCSGRIGKPAKHRVTQPCEGARPGALWSWTARGMAESPEECETMAAWPGLVAQRWERQLPFRLFIESSGHSAGPDGIKVRLGLAAQGGTDAHQAAPTGQSCNQSLTYTTPVPQLS